MKKGLTELVFILDKSGSMAGLENDTIGGYNSMLEKQQGIEGECRITTVLFDQDYELLHDRIDIRAIGPLSHKEYQVGGATALLDAMGRTIHKIGNVQKNTADEYRAERVLFVIITDGEENSSREYTAKKVKDMVEHQKTKYGWEFIFLGANIDAVHTAEGFGIGADRAADYVADGPGTQLSYRMVADTVAEFRGTGRINEGKLDSIRKDARKRGGKL
jgi:uncharacterized protein YegL